MRLIKLTCNCGQTFDIEPKDTGAPGWVAKMRCNWCPMCEDTANEVYNEWWEPWNAPEPKPDFVDPNQLNLF